nr:MFS transporter [Moraxella bovoculi]
MGTLMSAGFIGMAIGSMGLAPLADKFGRRPLLIIATALSAVGMLMTYFSHSVETIGFWRVITGRGVGGILPCTNVIVSEYAIQKWRGLAIAIYACGFGVGAMLGGLSAVILQDEFGFRSVFMTGVVLTGLALVALIALLPESVDFLNQKQPANALTKLTNIARKIGKQGNWQLPAQTQSTKPKAPISQLFAKGQLKTTLLIWGSVHCRDVVLLFYQLVDACPARIIRACQRTKPKGRHGNQHWRYGRLAHLWLLVSKFAPKSMLMAFVVLSSLAIIGFVFSPTLTLALVFAILVGSLVNGCITGLYTINPTLYAPKFRSTGVGTAIGVGRIGSIVSPILAGKLLDMGIGKDDLYLGASGFILLAVVALYFLKPNER